VIPAPTVLRHDAGEAWKLSHDEKEFRATFVEAWAQRINEARHTCQIDAEEARLAFMAVLSPIPYRRRLNRPERMSEGAAIVALFDMGVSCRSSDQVANHALPDLPYVRDIAAEYGITIIDDDEEEEQVEDVDTEEADE
jgi:hypothetical protein